jgi:hypothetical protein
MWKDQGTKTRRPKYLLQRRFGGQSNFKPKFAKQLFTTINKIVMRNIFIIILVFAAACMWACSKDLPDAGGTVTEAFANEWWVTDNGANVRKLTTYNTSSNPDSIWMLMTQKRDPLTKRGDTFQIKVKVDPANSTFSVQNSNNFLRYSINSVSITNGKIFPNAGKTKTGNVTDSIYLEAEYSNAPGVKHILAGVARTRWDEDDY